MPSLLCLHDMIKNPRFASNYRSSSLGIAARSLATSRCLLRTRKKRMRQSRPPADKFAPITMNSLPPHVQEVLTRKWTKDNVPEYWNKQDVPQSLPKPTLPAVKQETIAALEPDLGKIPVLTLRKALRRNPFEYKAWGPVDEIVADYPRSAIPGELEMVTDDYGLSTCPSHYFAVYSSSRAKKPRTVRIYPAQAFIVALYCANLRHFPPSKQHITEVGSEEVEMDSTSTEKSTMLTSALRLPVVHVCIPEPACFPILFSYLHNSNKFDFVLSLLSYYHVEHTNVGMEVYKDHFAMVVARRSKPPQVLSYLKRIRGMWANMVALGVSDSILWQLVEMCWDVARRAKDFQVAQPEIVVGQQRA